jgi:flagellar hook-length control protein FliK
MAGIPSSTQRPPVGGLPADFGIDAPRPRSTAADSYHRRLADALRPAPPSNTPAPPRDTPEPRDVTAPRPRESQPLGETVRPREPAPEDEEAEVAVDPAPADAGSLSASARSDELPTAVQVHGLQPGAERNQPGVVSIDETMTVNDGSAPNAETVSVPSIPPTPVVLSRDGSDFPQPPRGLVAQLQGAELQQSGPVSDSAEETTESGSDGSATELARPNPVDVPSATVRTDQPAGITDQSPTSDTADKATATTANLNPADGRDIVRPIPPPQAGALTTPNDHPQPIVRASRIPMSGPAAEVDASSATATESSTEIVTESAPARATASAETTTVRAASGEASTTPMPPSMPPSMPPAGDAESISVEASRPQPPGFPVAIGMAAGGESVPSAVDVEPAGSGEPAEAAPPQVSDAVDAVDAAEPAAAAQPRAAGMHASRSDGELTTGGPRVEVLVERISEAVRTASQQNRPLRVRLHPPGLGVMQVEIINRGGSVSARLEVQTSAAQQAVMDHLTSLRETLAAHNTPVSRIEVHVNAALAQEGPARDGSQTSDGSAGRRHPDRGETLFDAPPDPRTQPAARTRRTSTPLPGSLNRLDIQV